MALKHILLVEDSPTDIFFTMRALDEVGVDADVTVAKTTADALKVLRVHQFDLVLLDLQLPDGTGLELLKQIRSSRRTSTQLVIMITSSSNVADIESAYGSHVNAYVQKPVGMLAMIEAMRKVGGFWAELARIPTGDPDSPDSDL